MAITEARHRANEKYNLKAYDEIKVRVPKGKKEVIQAIAKQNDESVNGLIWRLIQAELDRQGRQQDGSSGVGGLQPDPCTQED